MPANHLCDIWMQRICELQPKARINQIHTSNDNLLSMFLSPYSNHLEDEFGGSGHPHRAWAGTISNSDHGSDSKCIGMPQS